MTHPPHVQHICNLANAGDILYVAQTGYGVSMMVRHIKDMRIEGSTVRLTKGSERVTFANGHTLHFATVRTLDKARGLNVWQVVTDDHAMLDDQQVRATLRPCFNHPIGGTYERYTVIG